DVRGDDHDHAVATVCVELQHICLCLTGTRQGRHQDAQSEEYCECDCRYRGGSPPTCVHLRHAPFEHVLIRWTPRYGDAVCKAFTKGARYRRKHLRMRRCDHSGMCRMTSTREVQPSAWRMFLTCVSTVRCAMPSSSEIC